LAENLRQLTHRKFAVGKKIQYTSARDLAGGAELKHELGQVLSRHINI
jgi:hypothetical protein